MENWSHKWFGLWKENGQEYTKCPSILDWVKPEIVRNYNLVQVSSYLLNSQELSSTSGEVFPDPFTNELVKGTISFRTDGEWLWLDSLPYYIEKYDVALPKKFLESIQRNNFKPVRWSGDMDSLDLPDL